MSGCRKTRGISPPSWGVDFTVFVWVGFDEPDEAVYKKKGVASALAKTSAALAGEVYDRAEENRRKAVRERREKEAPAEQDT